MIERTVGYVDQIDNHLATLTVHETLEFTHRCVAWHESKPQIDFLLHLLVCFALVYDLICPENSHMSVTYVWIRASECIHHNIVRSYHWIGDMAQ